MTSSKKQNIPLVRLNLIQPFLIELRRREIEVDSLLREFDLTAETVANQDLFVPASVVYRMLERFVTASGDAHLGVQQGERLDISTWSPFAEAAKKSGTISELLTRCSINAQADASSVNLILRTAGERSDFQVKRFAETSSRPAQVDAFWIGILVSILKKACGSNWDPAKVIASVCDAGALPENYQGIRISEHGSIGPKVSFPSAWLYVSFNVNKSNVDQNRAQIQVVAQSYIESFRQVLVAHIDDPKLDAKLAAELCDTNKRTLQLRLQKSGTTIKHEIDELRRQRAVDELENSDRSISAIACRVGYSNSAAFSRAFKKWTGQSPQEFRRREATRRSPPRRWSRP